MSILSQLTWFSSDVFSPYERPRLRGISWKGVVSSSDIILSGQHTVDCWWFRNPIPNHLDDDDDDDDDVFPGNILYLSSSFGPGHIFHPTFHLARLSQPFVSHVKTTPKKCLHLKMSLLSIVQQVEGLVKLYITCIYIYICKYIDIVYAMYPYIYTYIYILLSPSSIHHFLPIIFDFWEIHPSIHPAVIPFKNLWGLSTTGCCEWIGPLEGLSSMSLTTIFPHKGHDGHHGHRPEDMRRSLQGMMQLKTLRISRMWGGEIWLWKFGTFFGGIAGRKHNWSSSKFAQWNRWNYRRS